MAVSSTPLLRDKHEEEQWRLLLLGAGGMTVVRTKKTESGGFVDWEAK